MSIQTCTKRFFGRPRIRHNLPVCDHIHDLAHYGHRNIDRDRHIDQVTLCHRFRERQRLIDQPQFPGLLQRSVCSAYADHVSDKPPVLQGKTKTAADQADSDYCY
jgi:hypothetical protein